MRPRLAVVVSFCSIERAFIVPLLDNAARFADVLVVSVGTRLYNGEPEDDAFLQRLFSKYPDVRWVRYPVPEDPHPTPIELHNEARRCGLRTVRNMIGQQDGDFWVMFLDGDEIPNGNDVKRWWGSTCSFLDTNTVYKLANYWYFLKPCLVAEQTEDSIVLVHSSRLTDEAMSHPRERDAFCLLAPRVVRDVKLDDRPMFHHYSWVRPDLLKKVANWGHKNDNPWGALIQKALSDIDNIGIWPAHDFVHGYALRKLEAPMHDFSFENTDVPVASP